MADSQSLIALLASGADRYHRPSLITISRFIKALKIYRNGDFKYFITLGNKLEAEAMRRLLYRYKVKRYLTEWHSRTTLGNIIYLRYIALKLNIRNLVIVTSDFHMERVKAILRIVFNHGEFNIAIATSRDIDKITALNTIKERLLSLMLKILSYLIDFRILIEITKITRIEFY